MCKFLIIFSNLLVAGLSTILYSNKISSEEQLQDYNFIANIQLTMSFPFSDTFEKFTYAMIEFLQNDRNDQSTIKNFLSHYEAFHKNASVDLDFNKTKEECLPDSESKKDNHEKLMDFHDCFMRKDFIWILSQIEEGLKKTNENNC